MARIFVTGGTGVIGTALIGALLQRGDEVVGLARSESSAQTLRDRADEHGTDHAGAARHEDPRHQVRSASVDRAM